MKKLLVTILMLCVLVCGAFAASASQVKTALDSFMSDLNASCLKLVVTDGGDEYVTWIRIADVGTAEMDEDSITFDAIYDYIFFEDITNISYNRANGMLTIEYTEDYDNEGYYDYW